MATVLIHANGALDGAAIRAEVERQLAEKVAYWTGLGWAAWSIEISTNDARRNITSWVETEARTQRWPFLQAALPIVRTPAEAARLAYLDERMECQPINGDGNDSYRRLSGEAQRIRDAITARAETFLEAGGAVSLSVAA